MMKFCKKVKAKNPVKQGNNASTTTPTVAFNLPEDTTQEAKDFAAQIQGALERLQQMILDGGKVSKNEPSSSPAAQPPATQAGPAMDNRTASVSELSDNEMTEQKGIKERRSVSINVDEDTPANKRAKASSSKGAAADITSVESCP